MKSRIVVYLMSLLGLATGMVSSSSLGQEFPREILSLLASDHFSVREKAQKELLDWSRKHRELAIDELLRQSKQADDPEVRQRCLLVLREIANDEYLLSGEGYVGVLMQDERSDVPGDDKPRSVIRVGEVVPGAPGEQAGLKPNDLIAGIDDDVWRDTPASLSFSEKIRKLKPGTKIILKIVREGNLQVVEVKLGRRPVLLNHLSWGPAVDFEELEKNAKDDFFRQWMNQRKEKAQIQKP